MSDFEGQDFTGETAKNEREGLPPGYRMRADPHYVELLSSSGGREKTRPVAREDGAATAAQRAARDRQVLDHVAEDIAAIESAATMLGADPSPLARRVSLDLIKAQSARAAWLLRAHALLSGSGGDPIARPRPVGLLLAHVRDRVAAECRLVGVGLHVATDSPATVTIDDATLSLGVTGAVIALLGLTAGVEDAAIRIEPFIEEDGDEDDLQAVEISQDLAPVSGPAKQRFFEAAWVDRPGGWLAAMGAAVAEAAAERLGGRVTLVAGARRGCTVRLNLGAIR